MIKDYDKILLQDALNIKHKHFNKILLDDYTGSITGIQGLTGILGIDGQTGIRGFTGIQGLTGFYGQTGIQGLTGLSLQGQTGIQGLTGFYGQTGIQGLTGLSLQGLGLAINVQALTSSPADGATVYFGMMPKAPTTTANISKVYIRKEGTIKIAEIYVYSGTAGTNEAWSLYVRVNNTTDYLIATLSVNTNERVFSNTSLSIPISAGNYIEIKGVQPSWSTNPATTIYGGYVYIE
jgi:hypothetical protein